MPGSVAGPREVGRSRGRSFRSRCRFHARTAAALAFSLSCAAWSVSAGPDRLPSIDRHALVTRHNPELRRFDPWNPFTLGNGDFAFTVDATGLQTFADRFTNTIPLGTLSQWGWHSFPNPHHWSIDTFHFKSFDAFGRKVGYADAPLYPHTPEIKYLRDNPHRLDLGQIGLVLTRADGSAAGTNDLADVDQTLDLWDGILRSRFTFDGRPVRVETVCHPMDDLIAVRVTSPLVKSGRLRIRIRFPYGTASTVTADWTKPQAHKTEWRQATSNTVQFARTLDADRYAAAAAWTEGGTLRRAARHEFIVSGPTNADTLEFVCAFAPVAVRQPLPGFGETREAAQAHWNRFWSTGGAIDLSLSKDPRWFELERRIVLSEYLTAIQSSGAYPPPETGLTYNSWGGKFHVEMHWWHSAHFALWNRLPLLERSLTFYQHILPRAEGTARRQGYTGARWPKMTSPSGAESPSAIGPFLIWQEPHPIFYAELCYRTHHDRATLERYKDVVMQTAEFMASYPILHDGRYVLGPVLQCAQEMYPKSHTLNPTFELTYWRWGLETAQRWRERLGLPREPHWDDVLNRLAKPAIKDGKYLFAETAPDSYTNRKWVHDHPSVIAALGMLPGPGIHPEIMRHTLEWVWTHWNWPSTWGWDYPLLAMTAARVGEPERAVEALLLDSPKNHYALNGHVFQFPGLTIYLPTNGGLLYATAMMAAGWDGNTNNAPGFPHNGQWTVRWENLSPAP